MLSETQKERDQDIMFPFIYGVRRQIELRGRKKESKVPP